LVAGYGKVFARFWAIQGENHDDESRKPKEGYSIEGPLLGGALSSAVLVSRVL
jgi:hypothetical protein